MLLYLEQCCWSIASVRWIIAPEGLSGGGGAAGFEDGEVALGGDVDDGFVSQVGLLAHPQVLDVGGGDAAVLDFDSLGGTLCSLDFGLGVELLGFEVGASLLDLDFAVLFGLGEFGFTVHFLLPHFVPGVAKHEGYHDGQNESTTDCRCNDGVS